MKTIFKVAILSIFVSMSAVSFAEDDDYSTNTDDSSNKSYAQSAAETVHQAVAIFTDTKDSIIRKINDEVGNSSDSSSDSSSGNPGQR